jgi:hypothetical protein
MRKCFLHIGRHKTGTTAIQWALYHGREELKRRGYLYAETGIPPKGIAHNNIAWELTTFSGYQPRFGTIDDLIAEIEASPHHIVVSCEDFSIAIRSFEKFRAFIARLRHCGLAVVVVCYVRSPHDTLRSAFLGLLKREFPLGFSGFATAVLDDELVSWKDLSAIGRDRLVESLVRLSENGDASVVVRSYDDVSKAVVADFFAVMGLTFAEFSGEDEPRRNETDATEQALALLFRNVTGRAPDHAEHALIAAVGAIAPMPALHMSEPAWRLIAKKYRPETQVLASRFGVQLPNPASNPRRVAAHPCLEEVFSETMVRSIQAAARLLAEEADARDRAYEEVVAHYVAAIGARDSLVIQRDALAAERIALVTERDRAYEEVVAHYVAAIGARDSLLIERDALVAARDAFTTERDELARACDALAAERDGLRRARDELAAERDGLTAERDSLLRVRDQLATERDRLSTMQKQVSITLDTVLRSRSWRMTAPLRNFLAKLRKRGR